MKLFVPFFVDFALVSVETFCGLSDNNCLKGERLSVID